MLEPDWVHTNADRFDVFHVHFGFDARTPAQLRDLVDALYAERRPLVYTVHDLRNPHHLDRAAHDAQLDVLVPGADRLITLTHGAAAEIAARWGRAATVLPHPHVVDFDTMRAVQACAADRSSADRAEGRPVRIGVHVKSVRASMNPLPVIRALVDTARNRGDLIVQVNGHRDVLGTDGARRNTELAGFLAAAAERGEVDLRIHDYFTDEQLWDYLSDVDVSVLPYRFGTHSGWLEACRDLGTAVIAPDCGFYDEQGATALYHHDESGLDAASLARAVDRIVQRGRPDALPVAERVAERNRVAAAHDALYREAIRG